MIAKKNINIDKKYDFSIIEKEINNFWLQNKFFNIDYNQLKNKIKKQKLKKSDFFSVILPPPNITGKLHLGHAWNAFLIDAIVRQKKLNNKKTLFLPGFDHGGISTQIKINEYLNQQKIDLTTLNKQTFLDYAEKWTFKYKKIIKKQWLSLGLSLNYEKETYSLSKEMQQKISDVFINLYQKNLIYRDYRIISWDTKYQTALSNIEIIHKNISSKLYFLKYFLTDGSETFLTVATTRPETIFVDQALIFNPTDQRYQKYINKFVYIPGTTKKIPIIADNLADKNFGSGLVKITPAHDINDFQIGLKYKLPLFSCINKDGTMNHLAGKYQNLDRFICRKELISDLEKQDLIFKIEKYDHSVAFGIKSNTIIEPRLSKQWFLKMKKLASLILKQNEVQFIPEKFIKILNNWLLNIEDWTISRQIFFGHSIPAWYYKDQIKVQITSPGTNWQQEKDVLDTWFSSALWPFITLNWPEKNDLLELFFPNDLLVTAYDILFFWVARMLMQSMRLTKKIPFKKVLFHGLIRDKIGRKMSKSLGNGVEPMAMIEKYGADSLRLFLVTESTLGEDVKFDEQKLLIKRNFINKIWHLGRLLSLKISSQNFRKNINFIPRKDDKLALLDIFILQKFSSLLQEVNNLLQKYDFKTFYQKIYTFLFEDFANFYLEFFKLKQTNINIKIIIFVFKNILKILHPVIPFVTEFLYKKFFEETSIILSSWPSFTFPETKEIDLIISIKTLISSIRNTQKNYSLIKINQIYLKINDPVLQKNIQVLLSEIKKMCKLEEIIFLSNVNTSLKKETFLIIPSQLNYIYIDKKIFETGNTNLKIALLKEKEILLKELTRSKNILGNKHFLAKASQIKINEEKEKFADYRKRFQEIENKIKNT